MASVTALIRHSGFWNDQNCYVNYKIDTVVFSDYCKYDELVATISTQLSLVSCRNKISIKYVVEGDTQPMEIHNDMGVRVYVELKREKSVLGMYPLCVSITDNDVEEIATGECVFRDDVLQLGYDDNLEDMDMYDSNEYLSNCGKAIVFLYKDNKLIISNAEQKEIFVDQIYKDKDTLKLVMANYAIRERFNIKTERSNAISYTVVCMSPACEWKLRASSVEKSELFRVRYFHDEHTCPLKDKVYSQRQATSWFIGESVVKPKIANHKRKVSPGDIMDDVKNEFDVDVSYMLAWRAREKAMNDLRGDPAASYNKLSAYVYILDKTYSGSHVKMHKSCENEFLYFFVALKAYIKEFECCRPIVVMDGAHLKSTYNGTFVSASTLDGAGNILPLAYGLIDSENDKSWTWFFEQFKQAYGIRDNMCVVSDRHESIIKAVYRVYPTVPHLACIWHLWKNVTKKYKSNDEVLSHVFYSLAKAYTQDEFDKLMEKIENVDIRVKEYLDDVGREKWSRLYSPVNRGWTMTSNIAECINGKLVAARELSVFDFLEEVRKMFGRWNCTNRKNGTYTFSTLSRRYQDMLSMNEYKSLRMRVEASTEYVYTVNDGPQRFIIDLKRKTCSCRMFQMDKIPCSHAWVVLKSKNLTADAYCSELFKPNTVVNTYDVPIDPLPDESEWNVPTHILEEVVLPPRYKRPPGRPKKKRDKPLMELMIGKHRNACSTCGRLGHNRRSCGNEPLKKKK
ncbi:uncharacterized protein LOC132628373 [Lycium barbarum]|uniref:uncharacterized protein LOC132628373 n=1 Tax=Lycium barbarum TaxID=112863 RepID=UPI00293E1708|nr:uncharacterized protein LOC132628373 [Lycium barbarum]